MENCNYSIAPSGMNNVTTTTSIRRSSPPFRSSTPEATSIIAASTKAKFPSSHAIHLSESLLSEGESLIGDEGTQHNTPTPIRAYHTSDENTNKQSKLFSSLLFPKPQPSPAESEETKTATATRTTTSTTTSTRKSRRVCVVAIVAACCAVCVCVGLVLLIDPGTFLPTPQHTSKFTHGLHSATHHHHHQQQYTSHHHNLVRVIAPITTTTTTTTTTHTSSRSTPMALRTSSHSNYNNFYDNSEDSNDDDKDVDILSDHHSSSWLTRARDSVIDFVFSNSYLESPTSSPPSETGHENIRYLDSEYSWNDEDQNNLFFLPTEGSNHLEGNKMSLDEFIRTEDGRNSLFAKGNEIAGQSGSSQFRVTNARGKTLSVPSAFECEGYRLEMGAAMPNAQQGQESITVSYHVISSPSEESATNVIAKFAYDTDGTQTKRSVSSRDALAREVAIARSLALAEVPNIVPVLGACVLESSGLYVMIMPQVQGHVIVPDEDRGYSLSLSTATHTNFLDTFPIYEYSVAEQELIYGTLETVFAMLSVGVINLPQYHNLIIDQSTGHVTFIDFGEAHLLIDLTPEKASWMLPAFLRTFFVMIPDAYADFMNEMLRGLMLKYPPPFPYASEQLILDLWNNRFATGNVIDDWKRLYGLSTDQALF